MPKGMSYPLFAPTLTQLIGKELPRSKVKSYPAQISQEKSYPALRPTHFPVQWVESYPARIPPNELPRSCDN
ncbi:hypothetical protein ACMD2_27164 [Ananas comosus]|uniref:Uncharacterized protein n=1 Tax=Ananas comosus TaxID=4615 RepID=A0A199V6Q4_ANACO|nr:hypothetical protein ACMD2_27164 [Ananas comosus]